MDSNSIPILQAFNFQVPNSLPSLSSPSEPPDVGNWFSSYEYRSPDRDSNFTLNESASRGHETEIDEQQKTDFARDEEVVREKIVQCSETRVQDEDDHNEDLCLTKNPNSFSSCSHFSEPLDIRNWFSSYAYESSESDTSNLFRNEEVPEDNKGGDERLNLEVINEDGSEKVHPKVWVEENSSFDKNMEGDDSAEMKKNVTIANTSNLEKILQPCMQDKAQQQNRGPIVSEGTLSPNQISPCCSRVLTPMKVVQKHDTKEVKSKAQIQDDKLDISTSLATSFLAKRSKCTREKENDGFVTTRKNSCTRANDENSVKKQGKVSLQFSTNTETFPSACEKKGVTKRKALTEATNLQQSNATEITGKWQCPQKRKPYIGPALKQLRLERWVRKV